MDYANIFKNVQELSAPRTGKLSVKLPEWMRGTLYSITPGVWSFKGFKVNHFYDGYGVILKSDISEDSVTLDIKYVRSDAFKKASSAQRTVLTEYGTRSSQDDSKGFFSRLTTFIPEYSDNSNTQVYQIGKEIFVSNAYCFFRQMDQKKLGTGAKFDARDVFGMEALNTAPIQDSDGSYYCICTGLTLKGSTYGIFRLPPVAPPGDLKAVKNSFNKCEKVVVMPTPRPMTASYIRSVGFTKNYVILVEQPYRLSLKRLISKVITGAHHCFQEVTYFHPDFNNQFIIVEKSSGKQHPVTIESSEPFFFLDVINSYEVTSEAGEHRVVIDINCYSSERSLSEHLLMENCGVGRKPPLEDTPTVKRFVLPLDVGESDKVIVTPEVLSPPGLEFPTIHKSHRGKVYRFYYATGFIFHTPYEKAVVKIDVETKEEKVWKSGQIYLVPNGVVFVPRPGAMDEDDGILISMVTDARVDGQSFLLFLCAKTMTEISRAYLQCFLPFLTSSLFVPEASD